MPSTILDVVDKMSNNKHYVLLGGLQSLGGGKQANQLHNCDKCFGKVALRVL